MINTYTLKPIESDFYQIRVFPYLEQVLSIIEIALDNGDIYGDEIGIYYIFMGYNDYELSEMKIKNETLAVFTYTGNKPFLKIDIQKDNLNELANIYKECYS